MKLSSSTVLITGGASGIGLGLAARFLKAGSHVIVCGRREDKLREAREKYPGLHTRASDVGTESGRVAFADWAMREFPALNVLVNNAGIQLRSSLTEPTEWERSHGEIAINLEAPIHLSMLFTPHLRRQEHAAIINV